MDRFLFTPHALRDTPPPQENKKNKKEKFLLFEHVCFLHNLFVENILGGPLDLWMKQISIDDSMILQWCCYFLSYEELEELNGLKLQHITKKVQILYLFSKKDLNYFSVGLNKINMLGSNDIRLFKPGVTSLLW